MRTLKFCYTLLTKGLEAPFNAYANRADPDPAALVRDLLCLLMEVRYI